jgi:hypothetical protein
LIVAVEIVLINHNNSEEHECLDAWVGVSS